MDARLERKLRVFAGIIASGIIGGIVFAVGSGHTSVPTWRSGIIYGLLIAFTIGGIELFVLDGPMRAWLGGLSFTKI